MQNLIERALIRTLDSQWTIHFDECPLDGVLTLNDQSIDLSVSSLPVIRLDDIEGRLARSILRLQKQPSGMAIVVLPTVSRMARQRAQKFISCYGLPHIGWGLVGRDGSVSIQLPRESRILDKGLPHKRRKAIGSSLFSDLGRHVIKVLLGNALSPDLAYPPIRDVRHLAEVAGVSCSTSLRVVRRLSQRQYLTWGDVYQLRQVDSLLTELASHEQTHTARRIPFRSFSRDPLDEIRDNPPDFQFAFGGCMACEYHKVLHVQPSLPEVHVSVPLQEAAGHWWFDRCDLRDAEIFLIQSRYPRSVFGNLFGSFVDVLQAALDLFGHHPRAIEQFEVVVRSVIRR